MKNNTTLPAVTFLNPSVLSTCLPFSSHLSPPATHTHTHPPSSSSTCLRSSSQKIRSSDEIQDDGVRRPSPAHARTHTHPHTDTLRDQAAHRGCTHPPSRHQMHPVTMTTPDEETECSVFVCLAQSFPFSNNWMWRKDRGNAWVCTLWVIAVSTLQGCVHARACVCMLVAFCGGNKQRGQRWCQLILGKIVYDCNCSIKINQYVNWGCNSTILNK